MESMTLMLKRMAKECGEDTPLHEAAFEGKTEKLKYLLYNQEYVNKINSKNRLGCTPLRLAASGGHSQCVNALLLKKADVNLSDIKAQTPLAVAVKKKNIACVEMLLAAGAEPDGDSQNLWTPLYMAAMEGMLDAVKVLVKHGACINGWKTTSGFFGTGTLYITVAYHHWRCFRYLMLHGGDPDSITAGRRSSHMLDESLYHSVIRHNVTTNFAQLLYETGAYLYYRNNKQQLPYEMNNNNECLELVKTFYGRVYRLEQCCRITIHHSLGWEGLFDMSKLPLPSKLIRYLQFEDISDSGSDNVSQYQFPYSLLSCNLRF